MDARASIGGKNLTEEVGDDTQPCEEFDANFTISIDAVGDISLVDPCEPRDLPEPLLIFREIIREIRGDTISGFDEIGGEGTRGWDEFDLKLADDLIPVSSSEAVADSLLKNCVPRHK